MKAHKKKVDVSLKENDMKTEPENCEAVAETAHDELYKNYFSRVYTMGLIKIHPKCKFVTFICTEIKYITE